MKTVKSLLVTTALAFGIAGFAQAQASDNAPKTSEHKAEFGHKKDFKRGSDHKGGLFHPKLIEDLKLTDVQKAKYEEIAKTQKSLFDANKEASQKLMEERKALLSASVVNLKALLENGDKFHDEMMKGKAEVREKTLAFWDSLDVNQKTKVTKSLKERQERTAHFKDGHGDRDGGKHEKRTHKHEKSAN